jgi:hypothetical protein
MKENAELEILKKNRDAQMKAERSYRPRSFSVTYDSKESKFVYSIDGFKTGEELSVTVNWEKKEERETFVNVLESAMKIVLFDIQNVTLYGHQFPDLSDPNLALLPQN